MKLIKLAADPTRLKELIPTTPPTGLGKFGVVGDTPEQAISRIIGLIFSIIIAAAGAIFMILLIVGGVQYLTGAGNEEATGAAKKRMIDAIIGLIIVLAAWAIGTWIIGQLT